MQKARVAGCLCVFLFECERVVHSLSAKNSSNAAFPGTGSARLIAAHCVDVAACVFKFANYLHQPLNSTLQFIMNAACYALGKETIMIKICILNKQFIICECLSFVSLKLYVIVFS